MNDTVPSRTFVHITADGHGIHVGVPDVTPALDSFLGTLNWTGQPIYRDSLSLGSAQWPSLRTVGLSHLGQGWRSLPGAALWAAHAVGMARWRSGEHSTGTPNLLDLKTELALRESSPCRLCSIRCLARRQEGERGRCGAGKDTRSFTFQVLSAEEPGLGRGAAPRLAGCNAHCIYCSRADGIPALGGRPVSVPYVRRWLEKRAPLVDAIHWIGGNVDQELPFILEVMQGLESPLPVIWNHNATATPDVTIALLDGVVDVYLPDLRYGPGPCAEQTGAPVMIFDDCTACIEAEMRQSALIAVRHLALPGHIECCSRPVLKWLSRYRDRLFLSLLGFSYMPLHQARDNEQLGRGINAEERRALEEIVQALLLRRVS